MRMFSYSYGDVLHAFASGRMLNEDWFATGGEDGGLALWFAMKKKPAVLVPAAHGLNAAGTPRWISAIGCLKQSDLVVTGSNDGLLRLWRADVEERSMQQVSRTSCSWRVPSCTGPEAAHSYKSCGS